MMDSERIACVHAALFPAHGSTALRSLPSVAKRVGCASVHVKDESMRFGLPAFKILGASWALCRALALRWGCEPHDAERLKESAASDPVQVFAATDGNHGRALAHVARLLGITARIYVPQTVEQWSIDAIASEGADVLVHPGNYDEAVRLAAEAAELEGAILIQDTAWEGYEDVPLDIVHGYTRLFAETDKQLGARKPTHVVVPVGVGSLAHAAVLWYHPVNDARLEPPAVITVEPSTAACLQASLAEGKAVSVTTGHTIMPGLNCGTVSSLAWPDLQRAVKLENAITITDDEARTAMLELETLQVPAGPCGAAALAALDHCSFRPSDVVVLICTEGPQPNH